MSDTANAYSVTVKNSVGSVTSDNAYITYTIVAQPTNKYVATGTSATFTVRASGATGYQWYKGGVAIIGATSASYTVVATTLAMSGNTFYVDVSYAGGTCTSSIATLTVEDLPVITTQPQPQVLCSSSVTSATFTVAGSSTSALAYQWFKNGVAIPGATSATYQPSGLTFSDTANTYYATLINAVGSSTSNNGTLKYLILTHPSPSGAYLATGNTLTFAATASNIANAFQWKKDGVAINGATASSYNISTVTTTSAGSYTLAVSYAGGSCLTNAGVLTTSTILYSKGSGNINSAANWGVVTDGSGSTPVDFTRSEHTFIVANRATAATGTSLIIAGTFDVGNGTTTITGGTTFEAGRFIRSLATGTLAGTATSGLLVHGKSDLYFDALNKTMQSLTINSTDTVILHTALDMTAGNGHGIVKVASGVFYTGDLLTLKSDSNGTASVGNLSGTIVGKVTVERYIPAHRAWRLFCSPVAAAGAPTIHDAWQEGAVNSTDNPHPGFGTHITYGAESDGFDQNPQHSFSLKVRTASSTWIGAPATNTTLVTDYPAYFIFIRGNRSYDITSTSNTVTPLSTVLRTTGNLNQGAQSNVPVANGGFALVNNPYASPVDFESIYSHSQNISHRLRVWNPNLGGTKGTGAFVTVYWNGSGYSTVPTISTGDNCRFLQSCEGFYIEGAGNNAYASFLESDKDTTNVLMPFGRLTEADAQSKLAINLKVFNADNTTSISDGVAYLFGSTFNSSVDGDDIKKINNFSENLGIASHNNMLTVEERSELGLTDSLQLDLSGTGSHNYQFEFIPRNTGNNLYLWDRYLQTETAIGSADTSRITVVINTSIAASKAIDRFVIINKNIAPIRAQFTNITATAKQQTAEIQWSVTNTSGILYFDVERSANGSNFSPVGSVKINDSKSYSFTDNLPLQGINYYRVKSVKSNAAVSYTSSVNVVFGSSNESHIAVYPNPLTTNHCVINMHNKPEGKYELKLMNQAGVVVFTTAITASGTDCTIPLLLPSFLAKGIYQLQAESGGKKDIITLVSVY